jgi:hypothetical protein
MEDEEKKEILKDLLIKKEDTAKKFKELIVKSKELFGINEKDAVIIFHNTSLINTEKLSLFLVGKYFAKELNIIEEYMLDINQISQELGIVKTTLSAPLGQLVSSGYVEYTDGKYGIRHFKIEEVLDSIIEKYKNFEKKVKSGLSLKSGKFFKKTDNQNGLEKNTKTTTTTSKKIKKSTTLKILEIDFTSMPKGISDMAQDLKIEEDQLRIVFDFDESNISLLRKKHSNKDSEERFYNSLIYLTGHFYQTYEREIEIKKLKEVLKNANVLINDKFNRDMGKSKRRPFVFQKGESYKITDSGIKLGLSIIKDLINNQNV